MKTLSWYAVLSVIGLSFGFGTGCGKKTSARSASASDAAAKPAAAETKPQLTGADEVRAALEKKDYEGAMAALLRVRQSVATSDQDVQYLALAHEVKNKLLEASTSDPKATEALSALRAMTIRR